VSYPKTTTGGFGCVCSPHVSTTLIRIPDRLTIVFLHPIGMDMKQINLDVYKLKPHVVSTTLKRYFRELPEPLLTFDYYYAFIEIRKSKYF